MFLGVYDPLEDFIGASLEPIIRLLSGKGGDAEFVLETVFRAMANRTSIHDALVRGNIERVSDEALDWLSKVTRTRQYEITRLFKSISVDEVVEAISEVLDSQIKLAKKMKLVEDGSIVIVDQHEREAWNGVNRGYMVPINPDKKKNSRGFRFFSAMVKVGKVGFFTAFLPDGNPDGGIKAKDEIVSWLLSRTTENVNICLLLMDTGFYNGAIWRILPDFVQDAMCPAPRNSRVKQVILEHHRKLSSHYLPGAKPFNFAGLELTIIFSPRPPEKRDIKFRPR